MSTPGSSSEFEARIMVVDDQASELQVLTEILRKRRYQLLTFSLGRMALAAASQQPPDLVLLESNLPEMDGFEVCQRFKGAAKVAEVPIIFLIGRADAEQRSAVFRAGGADYVTKPFQSDEVLTRVDSQLKLRRARNNERGFVQEAVGGAVTALLDLLQVTSPLLILRTQSIRDIVLSLARSVGVKDVWTLDMAAKLSLIGCITIPAETFNNAYRGASITPDEEHVFRSHTTIAARLLANLPSLQTVVAIIRAQQVGKAEPSASDQVKMGVRILHLAVELDRKLFNEVEPNIALIQLKKSKQFDSRLLEALEKFSPSKPQFEVRSVRIKELRPGMVLDEDLSTLDPVTLIIKEGESLSRVWIERLESFKRAQGMQEQVRVRVPAVIR